MSAQTVLDAHCDVTFDSRMFEFWECLHFELSHPKWNCHIVEMYFGGISFVNNDWMQNPLLKTSTMSMSLKMNSLHQIWFGYYFCDLEENVCCWRLKLETTQEKIEKQTRKKNISAWFMVTVICVCAELSLYVFVPCIALTLYLYTLLFHPWIG